MDAYGILFQSVMRNTELSIEAKGVYAYLATFAGTDGKAFPSVKRICDELRIGKNRFYKAIDQLIIAGIITKAKNQGCITYQITDGRSGLKMRPQDLQAVSKRDSDSLILRLQESQNRNLTIKENSTNNNCNTGGNYFYEEMQSPSTAVLH